MANLDGDTTREPDSAVALQSLLRAWRRNREAVKTRARTERRRRPALSGIQRARVLAKTAGRCHICGGLIGGTWQADHVLAHSGGGQHAEENYLPAHVLCNNYRWDYLAEEFQYILKLGVWARSQVETGRRLGQPIAEAFVAHEKRRRARQRPAGPGVAEEGGP